MDTIATTAATATVMKSPRCQCLSSSSSGDKPSRERALVCISWESFDYSFEEMQTTTSPTLMVSKLCSAYPMISALSMHCVHMICSNQITFWLLSAKHASWVPAARTLHTKNSTLIKSWSWKCADHMLSHGNDRRYRKLSKEQLESSRAEILQDAAERIMPFFNSVIVPSLREGIRCLVVSHASTIRTLIKQIDRIADQDIKQLSNPRAYP